MLRDEYDEGEELQNNFPHRRHSFISILIDADITFSHDGHNSIIDISIADSCNFFDIRNNSAAVPAFAGDTDACAFTFAALSTEISTTTYSTADW